MPRQAYGCTELAQRVVNPLTQRDLARALSAVGLGSPDSLAERLGLNRFDTCILKSLDVDWNSAGDIAEALWRRSNVADEDEYPGECEMRAPTRLAAVPAKAVFLGVAKTARNRVREAQAFAFRLSRWLILVEDPS